MNQSTAQTLFKEGAFLIIHNVPEGTEFGMDWNSWTTGPNFKGIKMIPPGVHFMFYSAVSKFDGQIAPRTGFFHDFKRHEIVVKRWSSSEDFVDDLSGTDMRPHLKDLNKSLAAYPYETLKKWIAMSDCISPFVFEKLSPLNGVINSVLDLLPHKDNSTDADGLPNMQSNPDSVIRFSNIPDKWYPAGASPSQMSKHSMDSSYILSELLKDYQEPNDILGELQFTFICFILGQVLDAFEHWRKLLNILTSCENSISKDSSLSITLIAILYHQITEIPTDFFVDIVSSNNYLVNTLTEFFANIHQNSKDEKLIKRAKQFEKYLTKKFKWKFNKEPEDWAPVVVDLEQNDCNVEMTN